jgi:transposase-like protein
MLENINQLLIPDYTPMETGYRFMPNGLVEVAVLTPLPGCKAEWIDWDFGIYLKDMRDCEEFVPKAYLLSQRGGKWKPGSYVGTSNYGEIPIGIPMPELRLRYDDPAKFFDTSKFKEAGVGAVMCGECFHLDGTPNGRVFHIVRNTDEGCEMRTRFWLSNITEEEIQRRIRQSFNWAAKMANLLRILHPGSQRQYGGNKVYCKICNSDEVVKNGLRKNNQFWLCKNCGHRFINNQALPGMRYPIDTLAKAVNDYYTGSSLNEICRDIEQKLNILPSSSTVYTWIKKITGIALKEADKYRPIVGDRWIVHEIATWLHGKKCLLLNVIDKDTGFLLATIISDGSEADIQSLMISASDRAGKIPKEILANGRKEYLRGIRSAYEAEAKYIHFAPVSNNDLPVGFEQFWRGVMKDRLKLRFGVNSNDYTHFLLNGFVFHYNYIRARESLYRVPALAAKVDFPFMNWLDIISQSPRGETLQVSMRQET